MASTREARGLSRDASEPASRAEFDLWTRGTASHKILALDWFCVACCQPLGDNGESEGSRFRRVQDTFDSEMVLVKRYQ